MTTVDNLIAHFASTGVDESPLQVSFAEKGLQLNREEDAEEIVRAIESCEGMTTLRLEGNTFGVPAAKVIGKALEKQTKFSHAYWKDMFTGRDKTEIPEALDHLSAGMMTAGARLIVLDLSDNAFGPRGLVGIRKLLESECCASLQELHLNNNGLGISGAKMLSEAICSCIQSSRARGVPMALKVFVCGRNRLENEGAISVARFIKQLGTLVSVAMPQNGIYSPGVSALTDAFAVNPELRVINLEDNSLTPSGAKSIAKCLPHLKKLETLNLGDCLVRTEGASSLASVLRSACPDLAEVNLGFNEIGASGGLQLVEALANKIRLQKLNLNGNQFGDGGCEDVLAKAEESGVKEFMASLSEDEGDEDEDEENDQTSDEDEHSQDEITNLSSDQTEIPPKLEHKSPMAKLTFEDFAANPTVQILLHLHQSGASVLPSEPSLAEYLELFMKISSVVPMNDEEITQIAVEYCDEILKASYALCGDNVSKFNDEFLVAVGLLKGEDKKPKRGVDISGALLVLSHAVKQPYFRSETVNLLQFLLSQPLRYVTASGKSTHLLMQSLFQR